MPSRSRSRVASSVRKRVPVQIRPRAPRGCSSAGRAPPRHGGGHGFEARYPLAVTAVRAVLAQLAEAPRSGRGWSGFESLGRYAAPCLSRPYLPGRQYKIGGLRDVTWRGASRSASKKKQLEQVRPERSPWPGTRKASSPLKEHWLSGYSNALLRRNTSGCRRFESCMLRIPIPLEDAQSDW